MLQAKRAPSEVVELEEDLESISSNGDFPPPQPKRRVIWDYDRPASPPRRVVYEDPLPAAETREVRYLSRDDEIRAYSNNMLQVEVQPDPGASLVFQSIRDMLDNDPELRQARHYSHNYPPG